jgi:hypothetical protein
MRINPYFLFSATSSSFHNTSAFSLHPSVNATLPFSSLHRTEPAASRVGRIRSGKKCTMGLRLRQNRGWCVNEHCDTYIFSIGIFPFYC